MTSLTLLNIPLVKCSLSRSVFSFNPEALLRTGVLDVEPLELVVVSGSGGSKVRKRGTVRDGKKGRRRSSRMTKRKRRRRKRSICGIVRRRDSRRGLRPIRLGSKGIGDFQRRDGGRIGEWEGRTRGRRHTSSRLYGHHNGWLGTRV
jgi:hypothetical protein